MAKGYAKLGESLMTSIGDVFGDTDSTGDYAKGYKTGVAGGVGLARANASREAANKSILEQQKLGQEIARRTAADKITPKQVASAFGILPGHVDAQRAYVESNGAGYGLDNAAVGPSQTDGGVNYLPKPEGLTPEISAQINGIFGGHMMDRMSGQYNTASNIAETHGKTQDQALQMGMTGGQIDPATVLKVKAAMAGKYPSADTQGKPHQREKLFNFYKTQGMSDKRAFQLSQLDMAPAEMYMKLLSTAGANQSLYKQTDKDNFVAQKMENIFGKDWMQLVNPEKAAAPAPTGAKASPYSSYWE